MVAGDRRQDYPSRMIPRARGLASLRTYLWAIVLPCAYALVGTWALTPELASQSLARDVSATAVPSRAQSSTRPSRVRAGGRSPEAGARQIQARHSLDALAGTVTRIAVDLVPVAHEVTIASLPFHARPRNRAPYGAKPPPATA
jgi:hypothetical protein